MPKNQTMNRPNRKDERNERLRRLWATGHYTLRELANAEGISPQRVEQILKGLNARSKKSNRPAAYLEPTFRE